MENFTKLYEQLDQTQSTNEKVEALQAYFETVSAVDGAWALFLLSGHKLKRVVSSKVLFELCAEVTHLPPWLIEECYEMAGDTAETVALLVGDLKEKTEELSLAEWVEERILSLRQLSLEQQKNKIRQYWTFLNQKEIFILNKILTGGFRVGVSHLLTIRGLSLALKVPPEVLSQRLMGNWEPTAEFYLSLKDSGLFSSEHLNPYPFFLASPLEEALNELGKPEEWLAEWKWDGIRAQCLHRHGKTAVWSRGNELISEQFPELTEELKRLPEGLVLDGEIIAYQEGSPLPFHALQRRLGRKQPSQRLIEEFPVILMIYDLLEFQGEDLRSHPLIRRREIYEQLILPSPLFQISPSLVFSSWQQLLRLKEQAKSKAAEGLMLKRWSSLYGIGRQRGSWWKLKVDPMTIDAVLLYAQAGKGRRANMYTDYTFGIWQGNELIPIAKAYSGLDQKEMAELDRWIRNHTIKKFGPVRQVKPELVFEIAFEGIQQSTRHKSGLALRFPRIARWRHDKPVHECDTVESTKKLLL
ncbi:MAG: ATP-dependent DNA ligase [Verrucomicrobia bacterium]|nr:ATP-dependent DNA ligase [Verrucomicrobiota bacterium]